MLWERNLSLGSIEILGSDQTIPRDDYDLRRRNVSAAPVVCRAPWMSAHWSQAGNFRACRHSHCEIAPASTPPKAVLGHENATELRQKFRAYQVSGIDCTTCVELWKDGCYIESPSVTKFDHYPIDLESPQLRLLSLELGSHLTSSWNELLGVLGQLEQLELVCENSLDEEPWQSQLNDLIVASRVHKDLRIKLRLAGQPPQALPPELTRITLVHPMLQADPGEDYRQGLQQLAKQLTSRTELCIEVFVHRDNWLHLASWRALAQSVSASLVPVLCDSSDPLSLTGLSADSLAAIHDVCADWLLGPRLPARQERATDRLLSRLRIWQGKNTDLDRSDDQFALPNLSHPLFQSDDECLSLLSRLLRIYHHSCLDRWMRELLEQPEFSTAARERLPLRLLALWHASVFRNSDALSKLAAIYATPENGRRQAQQDLESLQGTTLQPWLEIWTREFHLERLQSRTTPFSIGKPKAATGDNPQITVLIPSYGHESFIERTIASVLGQTYPNFVLHVVDDQSKDATVAVAQSVNDPRLEVSINEQNLGLGASVAAALKKVTTPYVALLNSDDLFHPERLQRCIDALNENTNLDLVATGLRPIDRDDHELRIENSSPIFDGKRIFDWLCWFQSHTPQPLGADELLGGLLEGNFLLTSSNLVGRTEFFRAQQGAFQHQEFCLDWQLFLAAALNKKLHFIPEPLLGYRLHGANTVWFDEQREWRYYVESNQVVARALLQLFQAEEVDQSRIEVFLELATDHLQQNSGKDWAGIALGLFLERVGFTSKDLRHAELTRRIQQLDADHKFSQESRTLAAEFATDVTQLYRMRGERPSLLRSRNLQESLADRVARLNAELLGALRDRGHVEQLWHRAEAERDSEIQGKADLYEQMGALQGARDAVQWERDQVKSELQSKQQELEQKERQLVEARDQLADSQSEIELTKRKLAKSHEDLVNTEEQLGKSNQQLLLREQELQETATNLEELRAEIAALEETKATISQTLDQRTWERDELRRSPEFRSGHLLLNKFKLRKPLQVLEHAGLKNLQRLQVSRLKWSRRLQFWKKPPHRVMATACWNFPIYSQTFVYQELTQLVNRGFELRFVYSKLDPRDYLHDQFAHLWKAKRKLWLHKKIHVGDYHYYLGRMPEKVAALTKLIADHCALSEEDIVHHDNFLQSFSYTRMVEASGADYLHSYFFYDRSLMSLIAGYLLDLPRGVSCYADHVMDDYELKLVNLHLKLCDLIIATSARIKRELIEIEPSVNPDKILVKPNAINADKLPFVERTEPEAGQPFRLVGINRIEPKKGLEYLVDAMAILRDRGVPVELHLCGEADHGIAASEDYRNRLLEQIERLNLWGTVHMEGRQNEAGVRRFLEISHLFMAPFVETNTGDKDGIPTALLEAMSTGLPTVATNAGSMIEVIDDGKEGLIIEQRNPEALANAIQSLLEDSTRREQMSKNAAAKARAKFDVKVCEKTFHDYLDQVFAQRDGQPD